jgi:hypothetical protein
MAKIRSKQLADFVTSYTLGTAATDILNAAAVSTEISTAVGGVTSIATLSIDSLETAVSGAVSTLNSADASIATAFGSADTSLTTRVSTEESTRTSADTSLTTRVSNEESTRTSADASIATAFGSADTSLTTRVSTADSVNTVQDAAISTAVVNDAAHDSSINSIETVLAGVATGTAVSELQGSVNSLEIQVSTEESTRTSADTSLEGRISTADSTVTAAFQSADTSLESRISTADSTVTAAFQSADTSLTTRVTSVESLNVAQGSAITSLELAILEDYEMLVEEKTGIVAAALAPTVYTLLFSVQDNNEKLVEVFVNGVKAKCTVAAGVSATLVADYAIDATDVVTFVYQKD